jgi:threonine dehydrogenase-like Zn-dependent dehydrogenase
VFDEQLRVQEVPIPDPQPGEALIRVTTAGICQTDVEITKGYMGFRGIPGHEFVGIVQSSPDPQTVGARVVGEINAGCGHCSWCLEGLERHCPHRTVLGILNRNGAFAEYLALPASNLAPVPDGLPDERAVFVEPVAAALEILEQVKIRPADNVLVIGDGKLGLLCAFVLRLSGSRLLLVGKHPEKMVLYQRIGGDAVSVGQLAGIDEKFDVVVEASGNPSGWELAMSRIKPRGILVLKSTYQGVLDFNAAPIVVNEISVIGSRCGVFPPALRILEQGLIDPTPLIQEIFPFSQAEHAFKRAQEKGSLKILLKF